MSSSRDLDLLRELQSEIESFVRSVHHALLLEDEVELLDLTSSDWRVTIEFGKLIFSAWNASRSISRRVEEILYRDPGRLGVSVRKPGGRQPSTLEFRELEYSSPFPRRASRGGFQQQLMAMLGREYRGWTFERVSYRSDREHSFSTWYARGLARQGTTGWAFLGLSGDEPLAAGDAVLAFGLIWLDWLRSRGTRVSLPGLKLILPPPAVSLAAHRAAHLDHRAVEVEILEWQPGRIHPAPVDLRDFGNVETRLAPRRHAETVAGLHRGMLRELLGGLSGQVDIVPDSAGRFLSLRIHGLEVARVEGQLEPCVYFGLEGQVRKLDRNCREEFRRFLTHVLKVRRADSPDPAHEFYRLQSERWLESLLLRDVTRVDPIFSPRFVYPQVPAFAGSDRGVLDILLATHSGRLAVLELKVQEEINLPLQGLDYWLRVKWLQDRNQFRDFGYFPGVEISGSPPLLYLVCPAFRFHSTTGRLLRYLDPSINVTRVGINESWRQGVQVLFRREDRSSPAP